MSSKILIKRSTTTGAVPTTSDLDTGELAINTVDKKLYTNNSGTIVEIGVLPSAIDVTNNATVGGTLAVTGNTTLSTGSTTGDFSVAGSLTLSTEGTLDSHVVTKGYVDTAISDVLDSAPAALDTLNELAAAINDDANFASTITTALATKLPIAGGTMTGDIVMGSNAVTSTANPTTDDELTRKGYVDTILGSATEAATSASEAATSASNAANSASSASTSETNAAASEGNAASSATAAAASASAAASSASSASSSASAAATSAASASTSASSAESAWDSLDDRYLGAKSSDPTVDNDGDALITGAMYFDSSNNVMKVYSGTEWQNASSSIEGIKSDFVYTATASQVLFSGSDDNTNTLVIDKAGLVNVYLNGVRLTDADYTIDAPGNSVTLGSGATVGDIVEIEVFGNFAGQSGSDVAITGGSITGLSNLETATFTSTGIDDNATSTAITIDSSENVGIGTASPSTKLEIQENTNSTDVQIRLRGFNSSSAGRSAYISYDPDTRLLGLGEGGDEVNIDSSGNLLVGTTTAYGSDGTTIGTGEIVSKKTSFRSLTLDRLSTDGEIAQFRKDGSTVGSIGVYGGLYPYLTGPNFGVVLGSSDFVPSTTTGFANDNTIDLGSSSRRFKDLYLSGGVYLGGTGSANKLDDYEEGTFTPTVIGSTTTGTAIYLGSRRVGRYVKIGSFVYFSITVGWTAHTGAGQLKISGLPFTRLSGIEGQTSAIIGYNNGLGATSGNTIGVYIDGSSLVNFTQADSSGSNTQLPLDTNVPEIIVSGHYRTND